MFYVVRTRTTTTTRTRKVTSTCSTVRSIGLRDERGWVKLVGGSDQSLCGVGVEGRVMSIWVFGEDSIGRFLVFIGWLIFKELTE